MSRTMMEKHQQGDGLECFEFASSLTIYDPENRDAWITISYERTT